MGSEQIRKGSNRQWMKVQWQVTQLAKEVLSSQRGSDYRAMIEGCPVTWADTPDDNARVAALLSWARMAA